MRIQILSDLHLELEPLESAESPEADVIVLAGDINVGTAGVEWALEAFSKPVIYVPGNHEYYESVRPDLLKRLKRLARNTHVKVLDCESFQMGEVEFFGATLWSDFNFYETPVLDMEYCRRNVIDFHILEELEGQLFTPEIAKEIHASSVAWLGSALNKSTATTKVVVTHHAPSAKSVAGRFSGSPLNPFFVSRMEPWICQHEIDIWIHGHTHTSFQYLVGGTTVICNPRGYIPYEENLEFRLHKIFEVPRQRQRV